MKIFNTMSRRVEEFVSIEEGKCNMYCCGPTVYNYAHIGNLRTYIFEDLLKKTLTQAGYKVKHCMNITDVGHLTDDGDEGEDKIEKRSRETGKSVWDIAKFYEDAFFKDIDRLNIERADIVCRATDHIDDMISLIKTLEEKGHTYTSGGNVYFSIDTIDDYGKLAGLNLDSLKSGARIEVDKNKRNPKDFVLWFTKSKFENQTMVWPSPWGVGYPGWHIECSAMSMKYLGEHFDIHCGGIDAISVHHTNEIAQSEAATGKKPWVNYWCHGEFLVNDKGKMSKSSGSFLTLDKLIEDGYDPLDYRYLCLTGHYRTQLKFSYEALDGARSARRSLMKILSELKKSKESESLGSRSLEYLNGIRSSMENDLKTPEALSYMWRMLKDSSVPDGEKLRVLYLSDKIFSLGLKEDNQDKIGEEEVSLLKERSEAKRKKDYKRADEIRDELLKRGFRVLDTPEGPKLEKI